MSAPSAAPMRLPPEVDHSRSIVHQCPVEKAFAAALAQRFYLRQAGRNLLIKFPGCIPF